MKVFVTGGSGFIGGHLIETLVRGGHEVRALARSASSAAVVGARGAVPVSGDLEQLNDGHVGDAEVVVHAAAYVAEWGTAAQFWTANVEGTERALKAARMAGAITLSARNWRGLPNSHVNGVFLCQKRSLLKPSSIFRTTRSPRRTPSPPRTSTTSWPT